MENNTLRIFEPKTLEEYLNFYKQFNYDEESVVKLYIKEKGLELKYSDMIIELVKNALYKEQYKNSKAKEVIQCYNSCCGISHNNEWTQEENTLWDKWLIEYALNFKLSDRTKEIIKEKVPTMIAPSFGFLGLLAYINEDCGVLFKDQKEPCQFEKLAVPYDDGWRLGF